MKPTQAASATVMTCLIWCAATTVASEPTTPSSTLSCITQFNPHLSVDDPLSLPMKIRSLLRDEYQFFRGTADLFYAECRVLTVDWPANQAHEVVLHGDVHPGNIGTWPEQAPPQLSLGFGLVDFDETARGPFQFDLLRAACSLHVSAQANGVSISPAEFDLVYDRLLNSYRLAIHESDSANAAAAHPLAQAPLQEARSGSLPKYVGKFAHGTPPRFRSCRVKKGEITDLLDPVDAATRRGIDEALLFYGREGGNAEVRSVWDAATIESWRGSMLDVVRWTRVGSSGSQGVSKYLVLLDWPGPGAQRIILELKEEPSPAAARAGLLRAETGAARGRAVAESCTKLRPRGEWLVGYASIGDKGFLVRAKDPWSEELDAADHATPAALMELADITGRCIGELHRAGMAQHDDRVQRLQAVDNALPALRNAMPVTCRHLVDVNTRAYQSLAADRAALKLAARADALLQERAAQE